MRLLAGILLLFALSACDQSYEAGPAAGCGGEPTGPWQPVANRATLANGGLECGEEDTIWTNNTGGAKSVAVEIDNDCEFTAYLWTYDANGGIVRTRNIPGYDKLNDTIGVEAGGSLYLICTLVESVDGSGCTYKVTVLAES